MNEDIILKPSILKTLYHIESSLKKAGLTEDDILVLLQKKIKGNMPKRTIKAVIEGLKILEKQLLRAEKLRG